MLKLTDASTYETTMREHPAIVALAKFMFAWSGERQFETSWTTCSLYATEEEELLADAFAALCGENPEVEYLEELPTLVLQVIYYHAQKQSERDNAIEFLRDAVEDLLCCNLREMDREFIDDVTEEVA